MKESPVQIRSCVLLIQFWPGVSLTNYGCGYWVPTLGMGCCCQEEGIVVTWAVTPFVDLMLYLVLKGKD